MAELVVALDFPEAVPALSLARSLRGIVPWAKVGLELFTAEGPGIVSRLRDMEFKVFLDLKLHDIPNTVQGAVRAAARAGADMLTLHASGGTRMLRAAAEARGAGAGPLLMAVTMLTSLAAEDTAGIYLKTPAEMVLDLASKAFQSGLDGVVCSPLEARAVKAATGAGLLCLTPGIREASSDAAPADDQRRTATPAEAVAAGADFLVAGRPIARADDPAAAAKRIIEAMARGAAG